MAQNTYSGSITLIDVTDINTIENWYLATSASSGITRQTEGWTLAIQTIDSNKPYLWTYEVIKGTGDVVINTTDPVIIGRYGSDGVSGRGIVSINEYYKVSSSNAQAPISWSSTISTEILTSTNKYLWNYEVINYTSGESEETEKRIIGVYGDKPIITADKTNGQTVITADGTQIAIILDGEDGQNGHSPTITTSRAAGSTITKILADGVEIGSIEDGIDGHSPEVTTTKADGVTHIFVDGVETSSINDGNSVRISSATKTDGTTTIVLVDENGEQTLTIIDGEDGEDGQPGENGSSSYIHIAWANDTSGTDFSTSISTNKLYMGTYSDSNIADSANYRDYNWTKIKGETGPQGISVIKTETEYYRVLNGEAAPTSTTTGSTILPEYIEGCTYYNRTVTYLSDGTTEAGSWLENITLTNQIKNSYDAWRAAGAAEQKAKSIIKNSDGVTVAAGINGADVISDSTSTYGYNTIMAPNYLGLRYNAINLSKFTTAGLEFYIPTMNGSQPTQGQTGLTIDTSAITFYNPSTHTPQLTIGANGALQSGNYSYTSNEVFSNSGTKIDLTNGQIYSPYFRLADDSDPTNVSAGAHIRGEIEAYTGKIGSSGSNYWYIGNFIDSYEAQSALIKSYGSAQIQLGNNGSWRLATDRLHTAWTDEEAEDNPYYLRFPKDNQNYYWDSGLHASGGLATDKFLYIRKSHENSGSALLENLNANLNDQTSNTWDYQFYVDGKGNLYAQNFYFKDGNNWTLIAGADGTYLPIGGGTITGNLTVNGTLNATASNAAQVGHNLIIQWGAASTEDTDKFTYNGSTTKTITFGNAALKGVISELTNTTTNTNLPTAAAVVNYITNQIDNIDVGVTGTGTSNYLVKWNGNSTITNGPALSSSGTRFLREDGSWTSISQTITGIKGDAETTYRTGNVNITKTNIGLGNVENKSSATIRGELTSSNISTALGFTPYDSANPNGYTNNIGTVTSVSTSSPITGGTFSDSGTIGHATSGVGSTITTAGFYKFKYDTYGHVTGVATVAKSDITGLGIPAQDTTYTDATTTKAGLMSAADKKKLDGIQVNSEGQAVAANISGRWGIDVSFNDNDVALVGHSNTAIDASNTQASKITTSVTSMQLAFDDVINFPYVTYDTYGHITGKTNLYFKMPAAPNSTTNAINATNDSDGNPINTTYIKKSIGTAAGDIIYWSSANTPVRLAKGDNGQILKIINGVPSWGADNNTTYSAGTGLSLSGSTFNVSTIPVANGGTGATIARDGFHALSGGLTEGTADVTDDTVFMSGNTNAATNDWYYRKFSHVWNYIKGKTDSNYLKLTGGTVTGAIQINNILTLYREGTTADNYPAGILFSLKDTTNNVVDNGAYIYVYDDHAASAYGTNMVIKSGGGMFIGSGEAPASHYTAKGASYTDEDTFITADGTVFIQGGGQTFTDRVGIALNASHQLNPVKADVATDNIGSIGSTSYWWKDIYGTTMHSFHYNIREKAIMEYNVDLDAIVFSFT